MAQMAVTGGTIASFVDYKTGAVSPAITAEQLVNSVKALDKVANVSAEPLFSLASEDMKPEHWEGMAIKVKEMIVEYDFFSICDIRKFESLL